MQFYILLTKSPHSNSIHAAYIWKGTWITKNWVNCEHLNPCIWNWNFSLQMEIILLKLAKCILITIIDIIPTQFSEMGNPWVKRIQNTQTSHMFQCLLKHYPHILSGQFDHQIWFLVSMNLMYIEAKHLKLLDLGQIRALKSSLLNFVNLFWI